MYLNGNRLREAARLNKLTMNQIHDKSGLPENRMRYYWDNEVTVTNQHDLDALAKALNVSGHVLLIQGQPEVIALRSDKFSTVNDE